MILWLTDEVAVPRWLTLLAGVVLVALAMVGAVVVYAVRDWWKHERPL